ncbi:MAG: adenosylcobinamide-GDP ribazoletransferase [Methylococcales bacterium]|nr:adenosylcobinamide-GDP ribazoletransferase [Methylococcales bacterium]
MNSFLIALQFLTIIPITHSTIASDQQLGNSSLFYPVIGLIIGSLLVLSSLWLSGLSISIQAAIILIIWVLLTGGLHLDGLADCADAWVGGLGSKQRSLDIMKDPAAGPIAVVILVLLLLLKWSLISFVIEQNTIEVLLLPPILGRIAILILMLTTEYIRTDGLGKKIVTNLPTLAVKGLTLFCMLLSTYYLGVLPISFMLVLLLVIYYQSKQRLGGVTGDVYGASVELVEVVVLLGFVI